MEPYLEVYRTIDSFTDLTEPRWQPPLITKRATLKDAQIEQIMMWTSFATERSLTSYHSDAYKLSDAPQKILLGDRGTQGADTVLIGPGVQLNILQSVWF